MRDGKRLGKVMVVALILSLFTMTVVGLSVTAQDEDETDTAWGLGGLAIGGLCCMIIIIPWIIFILIAIWVYKDAEKRGKSGALWLVIVILTGIIGIIIWLVVRPKELAPPPGYPPQQPGYPPQQQPGYPPQQPGYPPQQPP